MHLNTIKPGEGARKPGKRKGRGESAGQGKTCGRGVKGQHARSGGFHKVGFEGGQMPLQRRLPKVGFRSRTQRFVDEIRLGELAKAAAASEDGTTVDLLSLRKARLITSLIREARVISSGSVESAVTVRGLKVTKGARAAIEAAGGKVED
ncbi:MAG: 50S ribosomal protein L15 [Pseudomonadota bacterium]